MSIIKEITRKELTAVEIVDIVESGGRVVIELSVLGKTTRVVIRRQGGTYYCDTPMKLLTFDNEHELRNCLERFKLAKRDIDGDGDVASASA